VYAVDWNQARENVLAGAAWLGGAGAGGAEVIEQLRKPTALICSSRGAERVALAGGRSRRDELLLDMIKSTIVKGGTVLIPTDSSARVLELAYLLEHAWRKEASDQASPLYQANVYLAGRNIGATMRYTRSMLEWMDDNVIREFEAVAGQAQRSQDQDTKQGTAGPFNFRHLHLLERRGQINRVLGSDATKEGKPLRKVILASDSSLEWGFSKEILRKIAADCRSLIILTERMTPLSGLSTSGSPGLARTLWSWWEERRDGIALEPSFYSADKLEQVYGGGRQIEVKEAKRQALEGSELTYYQQWLATQRQLQTTLQPGTGTVFESSADAVDDASSDSSSDSEGSEPDQQGKALIMSTALGQANRKKIGLSDEDLGINVLLRRKGTYDFDVRGKKGRERMFPLVMRRRRADDFGEMIRPEEYLRAEERDETDGQDLRQPGKFDVQGSLGKKRKWDDIATPSDQRPSNGGSKRQQISKGVGQDTDSLTAGNDISLLSDEEEINMEEDLEGAVSVPSKVVFSSESFILNLRLAFVDFAGLHDKRSLQMLIPLIQPRKLILVSGTTDETLTLASECRKLLATPGDEKVIDVYTPSVGSTVDVSVDTNAWTLKLTDGLVKRLRWQNVKGLGIVTLTGRLSATVLEEENETESEESNKIQQVLEGDSEPTAGDTVSDTVKSISTVPILDIVPANMASATLPIAQPLHVGDLRLADLRKTMVSSGYTAEFRGEGTLLVDGCVAVRKLGTGRIEVEGIEPAPNASTKMRRGGVFHVVKKKIYEGLAVVAGG
jgi:cleavage and polyadenylation specificity factor subunit 2